MCRLIRCCGLEGRSYFLVLPPDGALLLCLCRDLPGGGHEDGGEGEKDGHLEGENSLTNFDLLLLDAKESL